MRLIELKEKVSATRIPKAIFHELMATEVDTVDSDSPDAKIQLADEIQRAVEAGNVYKVPLSNETKHYLLYKAVPNLIDIAKDNLDKRLVGQLQKFQARLNAKLTGTTE